MALFQSKNDKVTQVGIDLSQFRNEAALRDFFAGNLEELLGLRFLANEYRTTDGRIDTLAIDEVGTPVIIEYKWDENDAILPQGLSYMAWLKDNKRLYDLLVSDRLGKDIKVFWDIPRLILVAQRFDRRTLAAAGEAKNSVELIKYTPYDSGILHLETVYGSEKVRTVSETVAKLSSKGVKYSLDHHLNRVNEDVKQMFYALQAEILKWTNVDERIDQKVGITYRTTKSFVRFEFGKSYVNVLVRDPRYDHKIDPKGLLKDVSSFGWGYKGVAKLKSKEDVQDVLELVRASYESTL
ncbi:MAG: hypothetical protein KBC38_01335 [Candidatus Pacebacteria bacterium]|nr:hypothetical protein [Candidatus Paceibacterota bacterium]MBP9840278.1 hypothetical protein [Candidatus Paceibacterota bacterium]